MIWVIDASVALRWMLRDEYQPHAQAVLEKVIRHPSNFAVPELFAFEVYAVLCRLHPQPLEAFIRGILPMLQGGIFRHPMTSKLAQAAIPFVRLGLTGYDGCYAALASELNGTWLTFDKKAHQKLEGRNVSYFLEEGVPDD